MRVFIVALPLFDSHMAVQAYLLCCQSGEKMLGIGNDFRRMNDALLSPGLDLVGKIGVEPFTNGMPLFIEVNKFQFLVGVPTDMPIAPEKLVCVLPGDIPSDEEILSRCRALRGMGYRIALDGFPAEGENSPVMGYLDYIMLDAADPSFSVRRNKLGMLATMHEYARHICPVVINIPDTESFRSLSRGRASLFTGDFYSRPITEGGAVLSPVKVNALHLLNQVNQEDFDLHDIVNIIERDPYLSISLLRFINSGEASFRRQIESIKSAVAILGQQEVRRWATVAISFNLMEESPSEITKLSLVRAKFAENLAGAFELGIFQPSLFMTGLFSLLDVILQKPMADAIGEVAVNDRVRQTLVDRRGEFYPVMDLIYAYERADWDKVTILMIQNKTNIDKVNEAFIGALTYYHQLLAAIDSDTAPEPALY